MKVTLQKNKNLITGIVVIALLVFVGVMIKDFLSGIIWGLILAQVFTPIYNWIVARFTPKEKERVLKCSKPEWKKDIAAIFTQLFVFIVIVVPIAVISWLVYQDLTNIIDQIQTEGLVTRRQNIPTEVATLLQGGTVEFFGMQFSLSGGIDGLAQNLAGAVANNIRQLSSLPVIIFSNFLIYLFVFHEFLTNKERIHKWALNLSWLPKVETAQLIKKMGKVVRVMFISIFFGAGGQTIAAWIIMQIFNVPFVTLWTIITFVASVLPIGSGLVLLPMGVIYILSGNVLQGVIILVYTVTIVTSVDNVIRAGSGASQLQLNQTWTLLGILGGVSLLGLSGIIIGPLVISLVLNLISFYADGRS